MKNLTFGEAKFFRGALISKIRKSLIQIDGPKPHRKFQHSSSIRKCLKIGRTEMREKRKKYILDPILSISKSHKNFNIWHFNTRIFAIRSCVPTEAIKVIKIIIYGLEIFFKMMTKMANSLVGYIALLR